MGVETATCNYNHFSQINDWKAATTHFESDVHQLWRNRIWTKMIQILKLLIVYKKCPAFQTNWIFLGFIVWYLFALKTLVFRITRVIFWLACDWICCFTISWAAQSLHVISYGSTYHKKSSFTVSKVSLWSSLNLLFPTSNWHCGSSPLAFKGSFLTTDASCGNWIAKSLVIASTVIVHMHSRWY